MFLFIHPEGDADSDQHLRIPVVNGVRCAELCLQGALSTAVPVDHPETSHLVELVIRHAFLG